MNIDLRGLLQDATIEQLTLLIESVYGRHADIDQRIESVLLSNNPAMQAKRLKQRIASISRGRGFIDYYQSHEFSLKLDALIGDIDPLIARDPENAFLLIDLFMSTHTKVYQRSDDSTGAIGSSYARGVEVWIKAASAWRALDKDRRDWPAELLKRHHDNDCAVWDGLIAQSGTLLTEDELRKLVWRFETEFKQAKAAVSDDGYNAGISAATLGIAAIAEALGDVGLFERSVLMRSPEPNELQKQHIVQFCLSVNDGESALKWLSGTWQGYAEKQRLALLDAAYVQLGQQDKLLALRRQLYQRQPDYRHLEALLAVITDEKERDALQARAIANALTMKEPADRIETLLLLNAPQEAEEQLVTQMTSLDVFYGVLIGWVRSFNQAQRPLAEVVCYRLLLEGILSSARSKAYDHAANYYRELDRLASCVKNYAPLLDWKEYQAQLRQQHGRKYSFWQRVD